MGSKRCGAASDDKLLPTTLRGVPGLTCSSSNQRVDMKFEDALGKLNESYFFREFTFSTNTFKPDKRTELEVADAVVWLDDFLIVVQVKERYAAFGATSTDEENWFNGEVLGKAATQIGNTLRYLHSYDSIELANNQGHAFNLADAKDKRTHKLIIYHPNEKLPE